MVQSYTCFHVQLLVYWQQLVGEEGSEPGYYAARTWRCVLQHQHTYAPIPQEVPVVCSTLLCVMCHPKK